MTGTKAKVATIKLEPGTDIVGSVKFVAWYPEKENPEKPDEPYAAQWCLTGTWEGRGEARVYIAQHQIMGGNPVAQGFAQQDGTWDDGNPKFKWTGSGPFRLHKFVKDKKHFVTLLPADGGAAPTQVGAGAPTSTANSRPGATPPPAPSSTDGRWEDLMRTYQKCVGIVGASFTLENEQAYVSAIATVFIEANKRGLTVPKESPEQVAGAIRDGLDSFAARPPQLAEAPDPEMPEWMR